MNLRYLTGAAISIPLLPLLYFQGKQIRKTVPRLPEATGPTGLAVADSKDAKNINVLFLGESTIAGVGVEQHEEGFNGALARELAQRLDLNVSWRVYARSGYTAQRVTQKLIPKITETAFDLVVVGLGGNDAFTLNSPGKWKAAIRTLIQQLQGKFPSAVIVFTNMPPIKAFPAFTPAIKFTIGNLVEILGEALKTVVQGMDRVVYMEEVITVDGWVNKFQLDNSTDEFFSDGVHPSKLTYQTWAMDVARNIAANDRLTQVLKAAARPTT